MCAVKQVNISEGVIEETLEYVWYISKHPEVVSSADSLLAAKQSFDFVSQTGLTYKWEVGYKTIVNDDTICFSPYLQLVLPVSTGEMTCTKISLFWKRYGFPFDEWLHLSSNEPKDPFEMSVCQELVFSGCKWPIGTKIPVDVQQAKLWKVEANLKICMGAAQAAMRFIMASVSNFQKNMALLLNDSQTADLKIVCNDGVEHFAHRAILQSQNSVLASMLSSDMKERNTGVLNVDDISGSTMKLLLQYFYTAELPENWSDHENIVEMTYASGKYQLAEFQSLLDHVLGKVDYGEKNFKLLVLANKLFLKKAEARLLQRVKDAVNKVSDADELYKILKTFEV